MSRPRENQKPGLAKMRGSAAPGMCPFCEDPLKQNDVGGRYWKTCGEPECQTAYQRCYRRDYRRARRDNR